MANTSKSKSSRSGAPDKNTTAPSAKRTSHSAPKRSSPKLSSPKLDDVSDAPESGEPRDQGRSRGRVIDVAEPRAAKPGRSTTPSQRTVGRKSVTAGARATSRAKDPRAAAQRDESGNTRNEAWESGRQKAMED